MDFTVLQGPQQAKQIIQASPSVEQLIPLTIAIDKDLGNEPRVAREIEEVAEDIRKDLENRRNSNDLQKLLIDNITTNGINHLQNFD